MTITIEASNRLLIDGKLVGAVIDSFANHKLNPSDVQRALEAYEKSLLQAHADALKAKDADAQAAGSVAAEQAAKVAELASHMEAIKSAPDIEAAKSLAVTATKDETEKKRDALTAQLAEIQKQLDAL